MADHDHTPLTFPHAAASRQPLALHSDDREGEGVFDALTDMFLGPSDDGDDGAPATGWAVELLVMGHLPVRARPWASQYAAALADRDGERVALVRIGGGYASVELFGSAKGTLSVASAPSLAGAIERARELARVCLVQIDGEAQTRLLDTGLIDAVTLLVAGNGAAVVDAYRAIKALAGTTTAPLPPIRVGVMGADARAADEAARKLSDAAEAFLEQTVASTIAIERMGPTGAVSLYGDRVTLGPEDAIAMIAGDRLAHAELDGSGFAPPATDAPPVEVKPIKPAPPRSSPALAPSGLAFFNDAEPPLSSFVEGLEELDLVCPYDDGAVLATDRAGALHVLRRVERSDPEELLMALDWGEAHRAILARATNGRVRADLDVFAHAFAGAPGEARRLRERHGARLRVHCVARVPAGAQWVRIDA